MKRKKTNGKLFLGIIIAIITLGIGYATLSGINLMINGSANAPATATPEDFKVKFADFESGVNEFKIYEATDESEVSNITVTEEGKKATIESSNISATANITGDLSATFSVNDMTTVGDYVIFEFKIVNNSDDIKAELSLNSIENNESDYFSVTGSFKNDKDTLNALGDSTIYRIKVETIKVPKAVDVVGTFKVKLNADPFE